MCHAVKRQRVDSRGLKSTPPRENGLQLVFDSADISVDSDFDDIVPVMTSTPQQSPFVQLLGGCSPKFDFRTEKFDQDPSVISEDQELAAEDSESQYFSMVLVQLP